jgi:hypothetical protein
MNDFSSAFQIAVALIGRFDVELREIVLATSPYFGRCPTDR